MTTDLLALLAIVFLSTALIGTLGAFVRLQRKTRKFQQEEDAIKNRAHQKAQTILETAQDAAFQIASEAVVKAEENRKLVQDKIEDIASKQLREYQKMVHSATENIEGEVAKNLELKMDEAFRDANTSIEAYKKQREKEIDQMAQDAVKKASREILGKSLDINAHTDLVLKCLAEAKKEYGF